MRFGIMEMQRSSFIPADLAPQMILEFIRGFDHTGHIRALAQTGFHLIELNGDLPIFFPTAYLPTTIAGLSQLKSELGLAYTVHLPLWSVEPSTPQTSVREGSAGAIIKTIRDTLPLDPEVYVLHATGALAAEFYRMRLPEMGRMAILKQFQANAGASIQAILAETGLSSRRLALETIEFPFDLTYELAERFDCSICVDTGHVLAGFSGPVDLFSVIATALPRLAEIHLHDSPWQGPAGEIAYGKDHQALGNGDLDIFRFLEMLEQNRFNGPVIFELTIDEALQSMDHIHRLHPDG